MKKKIVSIMILITIVGIATYAFINQITNKPEKVNVINHQLKYGMEFPVDDLYDPVTEQMYNDNMKNKLIFLVSSECKGCMSDLEIIKMISHIYEDESLDILIVWSEIYNNDFITRHGLTAIKNYSYIGNNIIASQTPFYFLVGADNNIIFADNQMELLMEKLYDMPIDIQHVMSRTNEYLVNKYGNSDAPLLVYFTMEGCGDCELADQMIIDKGINDMYDVQRIFSYRTQNTDLEVDKYKILMKIYNISWYPSFLIVNDDEYHFYGEENTEAFLDFAQDLFSN